MCVDVCRCIVLLVQSELRFIFGWGGSLTCQAWTSLAKTSCAWIVASVASLLHCCIVIEHIQLNAFSTFGEWGSVDRSPDMCYRSWNVFDRLKLGKAHRVPRHSTNIFAVKPWSRHSLRTVCRFQNGEAYLKSWFVERSSSNPITPFWSKSTRGQTEVSWRWWHCLCRGPGWYPSGLHLPVQSPCMRVHGTFLVLDLIGSDVFFDVCIMELSYSVSGYIPENNWFLLLLIALNRF